MANYQLNANLRNVAGKSEVKQLRRRALVPGNVYGRGLENLMVTLAEKDVEKALAAGANLIDLTVDGTAKPVIIKEVQKDPVKGSVYHVDFYEVSMDRAIETSVSIYILGDEDRVADGGVVNQMLRELLVSCLPNAIPDSIEVDISKLTIGDGFVVSELSVPEGVEVLTDANDMVVRVAAPQAEEEPEDEEGEEGEEGAEDGAETIDSEETDEAE